MSHIFRHKIFKLMLVVLMFSMTIIKVYADGMVVEKGYHPYVLADEQELEWRLVSHQRDQGNVLAQRLGYGHSLTETFTLEGYLIGERDDSGDFGLQAFEIRGQILLAQKSIFGYRPIIQHCNSHLRLGSLLLWKSVSRKSIKYLATSPANALTLEST